MTPKFIRPLTSRVAVAMRKQTARSGVAPALPPPPSPTTSVASSSASAPSSPSARRDAPRVPPPLGRRIAQKKNAEVPSPPSPPSSDAGDFSSSSVSASSFKSGLRDAPRVPPPPGRRIALKKSQAAPSPLSSDAEDASLSSLSDLSSPSDTADAPRVQPPPGRRIAPKKNAEVPSPLSSDAADASSSIAGSSSPSADSGPKRVPPPARFGPRRVPPPARAGPKRVPPPARRTMAYKKAEDPRRPPSATEVKADVLIATADALFLDGASYMCGEKGAPAELGAGETPRLLALQCLYDAEVMLERAAATLGTHETPRAAGIKARREAVGGLVRGLVRELDERVAATTRSPGSDAEAVATLLARARRRAGAGHKHCRRRGMARTTRRRLRSAEFHFAEAGDAAKAALDKCGEEDAALRESVRASVYEYGAWHRCVTSLDRDTDVVAGYA